MARLRVRVTPKSGSDAVFGRADDEVLVRVRSAPADGKATVAACATVAAFLGIPKSHVTLLRGGSSRHKVLEVEGVSDEELETLVAARLPDGF